MPETRRKYRREFKQHGIRLLESSGKTERKIAEDPGLPVRRAGHCLTKRLQRIVSRFLRAGTSRLLLDTRKSLATTYSPTAVCRSTIGAGGLNFRVRNGNGWIPAAVVTRQLNSLQSLTLAARNGAAAQCLSITRDDRAFRGRLTITDTIVGSFYVGDVKHASCRPAAHCCVVSARRLP